jgi:hypothetical protein
MIVILIISSLYLAACGQTQEATTEEEHPIQVEKDLPGDEPTREVVSEDAAKRLDLQTAEVQDMMVDGAQQKVVPYAAILYDTEGATWVYLNKDGPLTFVRHSITVKDIRGDQAFLLDGPPSGSTVVTTGATELYGAESEFEEE